MDNYFHACTMIMNNKCYIQRINYGMVMAGK